MDREKLASDWIKVSLKGKSIGLEKSGGGQKREWIGKKLASDWKKLALKENQ